MSAPAIKSGRGGWWFLATVAMLYAATGALAPGIALNAHEDSWKALRSMVPVLALVFALLILFDKGLSPERVVRYLGPRARSRAWLIALAAGILSAGPIYPWYPLLGELRSKGMRASTAAVFLYARAIKLPLLPLMGHYFGTGYVVVLSLYLAGFALLSGLLMKLVDHSEEPGA